MTAITFKLVGPWTGNKVACIKAYRSLTNQGLKESKDAVEAVIDGEIIKQEITGSYLANGTRGEEFTTLRNNNIAAGGASTKRDVVFRAIRSAANIALDEKEHELSMDLIKVLQKHDVE